MAPFPPDGIDTRFNFSSGSLFGFILKAVQRYDPSACKGSLHDTINVGQAFLPELPQPAFLLTHRWILRLNIMIFQLIVGPFEAGVGLVIHLVQLFAHQNRHASAGLLPQRTLTC